MSIQDKKNIQAVDPKELAKSTADTSGLTQAVNQKIDTFTAPVSEAVNKAKESVEKAKETLNKAQDRMERVKAVISDTEEFTNGRIIPHEEWLKMKGIDPDKPIYGGNTEEQFANSHIVYSSLSIGGDELLKDSHYILTITQQAAAHDEFEIVCPADALDSVKDYPMTKAKNLLGKKTTIQFKQFGKTTYIFTGLITSITNKKIDGDSRLVIKGHAPTILLENGLDCESYEDQSLEEIIHTSTQEYPQDLVQWDIRPQLTDKLQYTVQYRESDWDFIKRLATRYGEWLYYNGEQIVFGGSGGKTVKLVEEEDVQDYELKMQLKPQKFSYVSYDAKQAENHTVDSESIPSPKQLANLFQEHAIRASEEVFAKVPLSLYNQSLLEGGEEELKEAVKRQKLSRQNVFYLQARTNNPKVRLGDIVELHAWMPGHTIFKNGVVPLEAYLVTKITHHQDITEGYYNELTGVPMDNLVPDYMDEDAIPLCEEQSAVVTDNNDPEGMSRIRVQFPWQKPTQGQSPWIRVTTPYAGEGKGMHVIPEIGEEVMVAFENGNAEKPVVLGSMFNGKGKSGHGGAGNFMKGLQTAAGSNLTFNDQKGDMTLADQGGASMKFDGSGNATTQANVNNVINAGATNVINVGGTKEAPDPKSLLKMDDSGNITLDGKTNITLKVGENTIVIDGKGITLTNEDGNSVAITPEGITNTAKTGEMKCTAEAGDIKIDSKANNVAIKACTNMKFVAPSRLDVVTPDMRI